MSYATLFVISAPSGTGKSTLIQSVLATLSGRLDVPHFSVSHTTRAPRTGEVDGREYHFVSRESFIDMRAREGFLEWAEVHGNLYGTAAQEVEPRLQAGRDVLLDIDTQGAAQVTARRPDAVTIFIYPPSREILERRLRERGTESEETVQRRLANARRELHDSRNYQYAIINDDLERATDELRSIFLSWGVLRRRRLPKVEGIIASFSIAPSVPGGH
ncbi:MAG: guanylate kinase [Thermoanaerobaculia bacterium]|nr:guanylate kinase [Thermoanaerobaculia bacterium]